MHQPDSPPDAPTEQEMAYMRRILALTLDVVTAPTVEAARGALRAMLAAGIEPTRETIRAFVTQWAGVRFTDKAVSETSGIARQNT